MEPKVTTLPDTLKPYPLGWKAKLGFLVPSHDTGWGSYEFQIMAPDGVVPLETRVPARTLALDQLRGMAAKAVEAAQLLSDAGPDVIDFIPTAPCFILGVEGEGLLIDQIAQATGIQATGGARSCADALKWLGATKILSYTPYAEPLQKMSDEYFADSGLTVVGRKNLRFEDPASINRVSPYEIVRDIVTLAHEHPEADGVFCCGGCFRTVGVVAEIERECGIPVVGTQQANMWNCLRMCGVNDRLEGFGTLLERPRL